MRSLNWQKIGVELIRCKKVRTKRLLEWARSSFFWLNLWEFLGCIKIHRMCYAWANIVSLVKCLYKLDHIWGSIHPKKVQNDCYANFREASSGSSTLVYTCLATHLHSSTTVYISSTFIYTRLNSYSDSSVF